jgi:hypothetical protein
MGCLKWTDVTFWKALVYIHQVRSIFCHAPVLCTKYCFLPNVYEVGHKNRKNSTLSASKNNAQCKSHWKLLNDSGGVLVRRINRHKQECSFWGSHSGCHNEFCHLGYNAAHSVESQLTSCSNVSLHLQMQRISWTRTSMKQVANLLYLLPFSAGLLLRFFFHLEDEGGMFLWNVPLTFKRTTRRYIQKT